MEPVKEVCVESFSEAVRAVEGGASRIELCENLSCGGTTPSHGTITMAIGKIPVPVMVMIRPRGGDFNYSADEFEIMQEDILHCRRLGVQGVVFGVLNPDHTVDLDRTRHLVELAKPMEVTFHKAIDETPDLQESLLLLKKTGVRRILTSGGALTALEGRDQLNRMIAGAGPEMEIIVAGKVTFDNFDLIWKEIPCNEYHGRRLVQF